MADVVAHLENGLLVRCADGAEIHCRPLRLGEARRILEQWDVISNPASNQVERTEARLTIARLFAACYPELAEHIGMGDVENLLPPFFWHETGAAVVTNGGLPTGTPSMPTISPHGDSSPIPA